MNVLAAPFLYTMPSELEAFFCFAKFIEESCPLYVQPTLEGVHRGLKVGLLLFARELYGRLHSAAPRSMFEDCRSRAFQLSSNEEPLCGDICIPMFVFSPFVFPRELFR